LLSLLSSYAACVGQMRALAQFGMLEAADYTSCVSGGAIVIQSENLDLLYQSLLCAICFPQVPGPLQS
jgi:hypothetical protein